MNTTGKVILGSAILFVGIKMFGKKKETTSSFTVSNQQNKDLEAKLVVQDNGNWFVILNGKRWFTNNVQAIVDFQKMYPGNDEPIKGLTEQDLAAYPISGDIHENLELVPFGSKPKGIINKNEDVLRRLGAPDLCVKQNSDGSSTYYSSQGGSRPCPYGGRLAVKTISSLTPVGKTFSGLGNPAFLGI